MARPRQALLTRERIITAAATIIDAEGLEAVSTRRLAAELGVQGPSLYHHFGNKEEILDAVADRSRPRSMSPGSAGAHGASPCISGVTRIATPY